ncbi:hypothetical protein rsdtw13_08900 [Clostridium sp. TW13]|uniref:Uncharacterized protein n=1 Tax=Inconstantimicrobium mannanitabidum TaxID=1604901 RepID=A0ACB5R8X2_9CLOT|nr:hypothetical protein rsdtw13_08900 [Clostridium sp. TW13]
MVEFTLTVKIDVVKLLTTGFIGGVLAGILANMVCKYIGL